MIFREHIGLLSKFQVQYLHYCFYKIDYKIKETTRTAIKVRAVHTLGVTFTMILWEFDWSKHFGEDSCSKWNLSQLPLCQNSPTLPYTKRMVMNMHNIIVTVCILGKSLIDCIVTRACDICANTANKFPI